MIKKLLSILTFVMNNLMKYIHFSKMKIERNNKIVIQGFKRKYRKQVEAIYHENTGCHFTIKNKMQLYLFGSAFCAVAIMEESGIRKVIGFALFYFNPRDMKENTIHLGHIGVAGDYQGKKIGNLLLPACIENFAKSKQLDGISSRVAKDNIASCQLHKKYGFQEIETNVDDDGKNEQYYLICRFPGRKIVN